MGPFKPHFKSHSKKASSSSFHGARNTIQTISNAIGNNSTIFNGGSPLVFGAVKQTIRRAFEAEGVYSHIDYDADAPLDIDAITEEAFTMVQPTIQDIVEVPIAAAILRVTALRDQAVAANNGWINIADMPLNNIHTRNADAEERLRRDLESIETSRTSLMKMFYDQNKFYIEEREKFQKKRTTLLKIFTKVFGVTTLSTVNNYLNQGQYRRAWFFICSSNTAAAMGQTNAGLLLNELKNLKFNAVTTSFSALETDFTLLYEGLVAHGEPAPTDESRLYNLINALNTSPGKEFQKEIDHVAMTNASYQEARLLFVRKAASIATTTALDTLHRSLPAGDAVLNKTTGVIKCTVCKKSGHLAAHCWQNKVCVKCGRTGHIGRLCRWKSDNGRPEDESTTPQGPAKDAGQDVGSRFSVKNNKNKGYLEPFEFITNELVPNEQPMADHHIGYESLKFLSLLLMSNVSFAKIRVILDSGASAHMLPRCMLTRGYCRSNGMVHLGDDVSRLSVMGKGDTTIREIHDVLHVQGLAIGILAVCRFDAQQFHTVFANDKGIVYDKNGEILLTSSLTNDGVYELDVSYVDILMNYKKDTLMFSEVNSIPSSVEDLSSSEHNHSNINMKPLERVDNPLGNMVLCSDSNTNQSRIGESRILESINNHGGGMSLESTTTMSERCDHKCREGKDTQRDESSSSIGANTHHTSLSKMSTSMGLNALETLHRQWGHLGSENIKNALKNNMVKGCKYTYSDVKNLEMRVCTECLQGRMKAKSQAPTTDHKWEPLEKIAIDYKGDFARKAVGGFRGFMLLVDYATNWVHADLVKSKSEHTKVLKDFMCDTVIRYNKIWRVLQSDSESIFKSARVAQWLRKEKIRLQLSTPYQHWQNGQVEVYVRIVMDKARTIMSAYNVPIKYWGYAILYACYTMNRTPNSNTHITSYEALTGQKPDISNMVPFYAPGVYHLTSDERKDSWVVKARPCRMLGYADGYLNAYYILNIKSGKVIVRENCTFDMSIDADDVEEILVDQSDERNDVSEFDIMIDDDDSDFDESDDEETSDAGDDSDRGDEMDVDETGGEFPYWEELNYSTNNNYLFHMWQNEVLCTIKDVITLPPNPKSVDEALEGEHGDLWRAAITKELDQFRDRQTFGEAEQSGRGMKTKLILYYKYDGEYNLVCKARLVVCGYSQRKGVDYFDTYSPTTTTSTVFMLLCIAGTLECHVGSFDISAAFLEGKADTDMFAWLPCDIDHEGVSRRVRILGNWYGSKQAGKIWNDLFHKIVVSMGFVQSVDNPCLYAWIDGSHYIYLTVHVDDGLLLSNDKALAQEFMAGLLTHVRKAVMYDSVKLYLGMDIERTDNGKVFHVSQGRYITDACEGFDRIYGTPMSVSTNLRIAEPNTNNSSLLPDTGKLRYVADRTRPDILVALGEVSGGKVDTPSDEHVLVMNRIKCYLNNTNNKTLELGGGDPIEMFAYCDAAYVTTGNCKSRLGSCVFLNRTSGAISCISKNDTTVSHSSTEPEIKAIDMTCREVVCLRSTLKFLGQEQTKPTKIYVDNKSAIELCRTLKVRHNIRHINVRINYIRELINSRVVELVFVPSEWNIADVLTKALCKDVHDHHVNVLLHGHNHMGDNNLYMSTTNMDHYMNIISNEEAAHAVLSSI